MELLDSTRDIDPGSCRWIKVCIKYGASCRKNSIHQQVGDKATSSRRGTTPTIKKSSQSQSHSVSHYETCFSDSGAYTLNHSISKTMFFLSILKNQRKIKERLFSLLYSCLIPSSITIFQLLLAFGCAQLSARPQESYGSPAAPLITPSCKTERVEEPTSYNCKQDQECETKYEEKCKTEYDEECKTTYEEKCEVEYQDKCETKYEEQCTTEYEQKCETKYEQECKTEYEQECSTKYEEKCETTYGTDCKTEYEEELKRRKWEEKERWGGDLHKMQLI